MTTCTYCKCEVSERDAAPDDVARHRDLFVCSFALMRRVAELEEQCAVLGAAGVKERALSADIVHTLSDRIKMLIEEVLR